MYKISKRFLTIVLNHSIGIQLVCEKEIWFIYCNTLLCFLYSDTFPKNVLSVYIYIEAEFARSLYNGSEIQCHGKYFQSDTLKVGSVYIANSSSSFQ